MRSKFIRGAAALALATLGPASAQAANVTLTGWAYGSGNTINSTMYQGAAGGFTGALSDAGGFDASPFVTYCVELTESFSFSATPMAAYSIVAGDSYFGSTKADSLGKLMSWVDDHPGTVDTAAESTSLQLAIWNIVYDSDFSVSTASVFRDNSAYAAQANVLLAGAQSEAASKYTVFALQKSGSQDFLLLQRNAELGALAAPLPEPTTAALVAVALAGLGWSRRRRA